MLHIATEEDIRAGRVTDAYFENTRRVLQAKGIHKQVVMEIRASTLPDDWEWAVLAGIEEIASMMTGIDASIWCMPEGTVFHAGDPILTIIGDYTQFGIYETVLLGLLCQASGIATKAARCKQAAGERFVVSFGARRMHPALAPMIERNAFIGGCDGVAVIMSGDLIGESALGTMPHALILVLGDSVQAFRLFDEVMPADVRRICLVDTLGDEKFEAVAAAQTLGDRLFGVRLDTPGSRRGDMAAILSEVRWELDLRGFQNIRLIVSGGLDESIIPELNAYCDGYGVGTAIANAPTVNFAMDIVEVDGTSLAKRGKESGRKQVLRCPRCHSRQVVPATHQTSNELAPTMPVECICGAVREALLIPLIQSGSLVRRLPSAQELRKHVIQEIGSLR